MSALSRTDFEVVMQKWRRNVAAPPHRSLWLQEALSQDKHEARPLQGAVRADICIVGGGFTGLWTAIRLHELDPALNIALVEADLCGAGASGRCSGGIGGWWGKLPSLVNKLGNEDALRLLQAGNDAVADIETFIAVEEMACEFQRSPSVWSATAAAQIGAWESVFEIADRLGLQPPWRRLSEADIKGIYGTSGPVLAGVIADRSPRAQPALLAQGLRDAALRRKILIFEQSPVVRIISAANKVLVECANGSVEADKIVLAANAWMAHLAEFKPYVMVVSSEIVSTDPISELLESKGMRERPGGINSRLMLNYGGITQKGQVYLGRGGGTIAFAGKIGPAFDCSEQQIREVEQDFRFLYPELGDVALPYGWSGPIDRTISGMPWFGHLKGSECVHFAIGYSGHGVAASALAGRILASSVLRRQDRWTDLLPLFLKLRNAAYPPEPIRYIGSRIVRAAVKRKEHAEREGVKSARLDRALARLAPGTISDFRRPTPP